MSNLQEIQGSWRSVGYGQIWHFGPDGLVIYDTSPVSCVQARRETPDSLPRLIDRYELQGDDRLFVYRTGGIAHYQFVRLQDAPPTCRPVDAAAAKDPVLNFEVFWRYFDEHYGYFELRDIDWQGVYDTHRPQVTAATSDEELIDVFRKMIEPLGDSHVTLQAGDQQVRSARPNALWEQWAIDFDPNDERGSMIAGMKKVQGVILEDILGGEGQVDAGGLVVWGKAAPRIGYLCVMAMYGYAGFDAPFADQLAALTSAMDRVIDDFQDVDAVIIDMRFNGGGEDSLARVIANRFTDRKRLAFSKKTVDGDGFTEPQEVYIYPEGRHQFTGPTVLLTSKATVSAAEIFTLYAMVLPHVTRMGEATNGAFSDAHQKRLPNSWTISLSNEVYTAADGRIYEMTGIPADQKTPVFVPGCLYSGLQLAVDKACTLLSRRLEAAGKRRRLDLDAFVAERMSRTQMPGLAACVVRGDNMVWSGGYGWADIEGRIPMTVDTVMNIGSVSKTITNTAVMQCLERGLLRLGDDVSRLIPLQVRNPAYPDSPVTVLQLLTHTSSINDGPAYFSSYACGDPIVSLGDWIREYFCPNGAYYDASASFHPWRPGERFAYSNLGFGLLGYLVEELTGEPFSAYCKQHIFEPLGMRSTAWFLRDLQGVVPAVPYTVVRMGEQRGECMAADGAVRPENGHVANSLYGFPNYPDGLLHTSVRDLSAFLMAHIIGGAYAGHRLLQADTIRQITTYHIDPSLSTVPGAMIGLTWHEHRVEGQDPLWGHTGGDPGISTSMSYRPADGVGVIAFTNSGWAFGLEDVVARLFEEAVEL